MTDEPVPVTNSPGPVKRSRRRCILWAVALTVPLLGGYLGCRAFYRSPGLVEHKVLDKPVRLVALAPPNVVEVEGGGKYELAFVVFLFEDRKTGVRKLFPDFPPRRDNRPVMVEPVSPGGRSTRFNLRYEYWYGCGNTFFPRWFPRDLPSYEKRDLAAALVLAGHAKPADDLPEDASGYAAELRHNYAFAEERKKVEAAQEKQKQ